MLYVIYYILYIYILSDPGTCVPSEEESATANHAAIVQTEFTGVDVVMVTRPSESDGSPGPGESDESSQMGSFWMRVMSPRPRHTGSTQNTRV